MAKRTVSINLRTALEQRCQRIFKSRSTVLFRRGDKAFGMFLVLSGTISLDFGVDSSHAQCYGSGALVGFPATLTKGLYSMTATVTENAHLGFLPVEAVEELLRDHPDVCQEFLSILGQRLLEMQRMRQAILDKTEPPEQVSRLA